MVLPEDELKIFNEMLEIRLEATNQQLKKLLLLVETSSRSWYEEGQRDGTDKKHTNLVTRHVSTRKHVLPKRMSNNPLTNVFSRSKTSRSTSKAPPTTQKKTKV